MGTVWNIRGMFCVCWERRSCTFGAQEFLLTALYNMDIMPLIITIRIEYFKLISEAQNSLHLQQTHNKTAAKNEFTAFESQIVFCSGVQVNNTTIWW